MNACVPQNIIFSIVLDKAYDVNILEREVFIPTGQANEQRTTLTESYRGPGATMLSNLCFNTNAVFFHKRRWTSGPAQTPVHQQQGRARGSLW